MFVQTDNTAGNRVVAYRRAADGTLTPAGSYATGGRGGILAGSVVDHTASQGPLTEDPRHGLLYAVNAGSNTISVFAVRGDRLALRQVLGSGGTFPVSVAVHGDLVYVLNALNGGSVQGYRVLGSFLARIPGSHRALGLDPNATPQFTTTPGQVAFTPDGAQLVVTTKGNGNDIDVFGVGFGGRLVRQADRERRARHCPVRDLLRPVRPSGDRRSRDERPGCLPAQPERHGQPARPDAHRAGRDLLLRLRSGDERASRRTWPGCPHCTEYLAQMRETISLTGRLEPGDLTPQMRDEFTDLYRRWRSEQ